MARALEQQPMTDERLARLLAQIATISPEREHTTALVSDLQLLRIAVERLRAREAALVAVVRAVAEADNSDNSVCYQVCDYAMHGEWMIEHEAPCVVKQARALLAASTDAPTAE